MATASKSEPRWERRKDDRPDELVAAALDLFVEKGFAVTRLEDVASRAGVSKGTLYLYFDSKDALFKAVVRSAIIPAITEAERLVEHFEGTASDLLRAIIYGWWRLIGSSKVGGIPKLMIAEAGNFPELAQFYHDEVVVRGLDMVRRALQRGIDSGEFRQVDLEPAVHLVIAPLVHFACWQHSLAACAPNALTAERYFGTLIDLLLPALRGIQSGGGTS
ncbi:MAG: TetR/AcrR family transcriptional regulator [Betaproteobacteria bacterium]|nr:TetR/AcrR family transcriptional regulator [Betaproteobacteria bacterium]